MEDQDKNCVEDSIFFSYLLPVYNAQYVIFKSYLKG